LLESAKPLEDMELIEQKLFVKEEYQEVFANMHSASLNQ
jgi:hypothetical protein